MVLAKYLKVYHWPPLCYLSFVLSFVIMYTLAVVITKHVYPWFPYLSDTGAIQPASCVFSHCFNFGALIVFVVFYIRYRQIDIGILNGNVGVAQKLNNISLTLAISMCLGMAFTANFQETAVPSAHFSGAFLLLGLGTFYFIIQTVISYHCYKAKEPAYRISKGLYIFRTLMAITITITVPLTIGGLFISKQYFTGKHVYYWTPNDGAFAIRLMSTLSEWISLITMLNYVLTFTNEFKNIKFGGIKFIDTREETLNNKEELNVL